MRGIVKRYGAIVALDGVDLDVARGEVHAVVGENGAGKTTLMQILAGVVAADSGGIAIRGGRCANCVGGSRLSPRHRDGSPALHAVPVAVRWPRT